MTESFPLKWPIGWDRTPKYSRKVAKFNTTPGRARDELLHELKLLGAKDVVISTNVATYRRGGMDIPYADQSAAKEDPGVAVYYTWKGEQYALACDRWTSIMDNMQALKKTVDAIRGIERWGTGGMIKAAFAGFKALPEKVQFRDCWEVLDIKPTDDESLINQAYRKGAFKYHPDHGGSSQQFQELKEAYNRAMAYANGN